MKVTFALHITNNNQQVRICMESKNNRLLIVCEGETEEVYFRSIIKMLGLSGSVKVMKDARYTAPKSLLEAGCKELYWSRLMHSCPYTEVWLIFDRDHHDSYANVLKTMKNLNEPVFAAWSNPCIEYWFWLHYSRQTDSLKRDEEFKEQLVKTEQADISGATLRTTVERVWQGMKPETMLQSLKSVCPGYKKAQIPDGMLGLTSLALSAADTVSQADSPFQMGTAVPILIRRLVALTSNRGALAGLGFQREMTAKVIPPDSVTKLSMPPKPQSQQELKRLIEKSQDQAVALKAAVASVPEQTITLSHVAEKVPEVAGAALVLRQYYSGAASEVLRLAGVILEECERVYAELPHIKRGTESWNVEEMQRKIESVVAYYSEIKRFLF